MSADVWRAAALVVIAITGVCVFMALADIAMALEQIAGAALLRP